jgi:hypothetical protein
VLREVIPSYPIGALLHSPAFVPGAPVVPLCRFWNGPLLVSAGAVTPLRALPPRRPEPPRLVSTPSCSATGAALTTPSASALLVAKLKKDGFSELLSPHPVCSIRMGMQESRHRAPSVVLIETSIITMERSVDLEQHRAVANPSFSSKTVTISHRTWWAPKQAGGHNGPCSAHGTVECSEKLSCRGFLHHSAQETFLRCVCPRKARCGPPGRASREAKCKQAWANCPPLRVSATTWAPP